MSLISDYFRELGRLIEKYGPNTILLSQQGTFYECYGFDPKQADPERCIDFYGSIIDKPIGIHALPHSINEIEDFTHGDVTKKNKSAPYSVRDNPNMIGIPLVKYDRRKRTLVEKGYTVVCKSEVKNGKEVTRFISEILSPHTDLDIERMNVSSNSVSMLYIQYQSGDVPESMDIVAGVAMIDIMTGTGRVAQFYSQPEDQDVAIQQVFRVLTSNRPRELVIHLVDFPNPDEYLSWLESALDLHKFGRWVRFFDQVRPEIYKKAYQIEYFNKLFNNRMTEQHENFVVISSVDQNILENLGLDGMVEARLAYILLVNHYQEYTSGVTDFLRPPEVSWIDEETHLVLAHNAAQQLNLLENLKFPKDTLFNVINITKTNLGRRRLKHLILHPFTDPKTLNDSYDVVEELMQSRDKLIHLETSLSSLPDFEKLQRKLLTSQITPKEMNYLFTGYTKVATLYSELLEYSHLRKHLFSNPNVISFNKWLSHYSQYISFKDLADCAFAVSENGSKNINFKNWPLPQVCQSEIASLHHAESILQRYVTHLNEVSDAGVKLEQQKKVGGTKKILPLVMIVATSKGQQLLRSEYSRELGEITLKKDTESRMFIRSPVIDQLLDFVEQAKSFLRLKLFEEWTQIIKTMQDPHGSYTFYKELERVIGTVDVWCSFARNALSSGYHKPEIVPGEKSDGSFIEALDIRHPVIEKIITGKYVTNDITLCQNGVLLHGLNSVGKSSLVKAIPINIVLAQIGSWTAGKIRYRPYNKIITRLEGGDNMSKNASTFKVEMAELRTIIRQADNRSLVVGDELAHSSDVLSASALTASSLVDLAAAGSSFMFATHLHDVLQIEEVKELIDSGKVRALHLSTSRGPNGCVYNRKLQPGPGDSVYGVLVAESMRFPPQFIQRAYSILSRLTNKANVVSGKTSRYNPEVYVTRCTKCGSSKDLHTHHIQEQNMANNDGLIVSPSGIQHKNSKDNLVVLCRQCHSDVHSGSGLHTLDTSSGVIVIQTQPSSQTDIIPDPS
jgi:DNA mismatch repair protein MutS